MKNIHIIPTDSPSRLIKDVWNNTFSIVENFNTTHTDFKAQHIYITSDEEIKDGDFIFEADTNCINIADKDYHRNEFDFKIVMSTDEDLIKYGVQAIDDEFLQWFVNNSSCVEVKIRKNPKVNAVVKGLGIKSFSNGYRIIKPKSELASKLKELLDGMSQEEFDEEWKKITDLKLEGPSMIIPAEETMMSKILIINASIRGQEGNSYQIALKAKSYIEKSNLSDVEIYDIANPKSTIDEVYELVKKSDAFLIVSGTYWNNIGSGLQRFIEVCTPFENSDAFFGKPLSTIISMDSVGGIEVANKITSAFSGLGCWTPPCSTVVLSRIGQEAAMLTKDFEDDTNKDVWRLDDIEILIDNLSIACKIDNKNWKAWDIDRLASENKKWPESGVLNLDSPKFIDFKIHTDETEHLLSTESNKKRLLQDVEKKQEQKQHLIDMMKGDEELGLYEETTKCYCGHTTYCDCGPEEPKQEITLEEVFNEEKVKGVKELIDKHKQETIEEAAKKYVEINVAKNAAKLMYKEHFIAGAKWQREKLCDSELIQRIRASKSDAEARRIIRTF